MMKILKWNTRQLFIVILLFHCCNSLGAAGDENISIKLKKSSFNIEDEKLFTVSITNHYLDQLLIPSWLYYGYKNDCYADLFIVIQKKNKKNKYKNLEIKNLHYTYNISDRDIQNLSIGENEQYEQNLEFYYSLNQTGIYRVKVFVNLSKFDENFKHFKSKWLEFEITD